MKNELLDLFEIASRYNHVINKAEKGDYNAGFKSFFIPKKDKPLFPNKDRYTMLIFINNKFKDLNYKNELYRVYKILNEKKLITPNFKDEEKE